MRLDQLADYVAEVQHLQREAPDFVLLGIEADYHPTTIEAVGDLLAAYPFDYVIGSVHFLDEWGFDDPRNSDGWAQRDVDDVYLQLPGGGGRRRRDGALHHPRSPGPGQEVRPPSDASPGRLARDARRGASPRPGVVVELNTAGLRKPVGEIYPSVEWLRVLRAHGVPITFGSDAHRPRDVGADLAAAVEAARAAGYHEYAWLARGRRRLDRTTRAQRGDPAPPVRIGLICNPIAGGGRGAGAGQAARARLKARGHDVVFAPTGALGHAIDLARDLARVVRR